MVIRKPRRLPPLTGTDRSKNYIVTDDDGNISNPNEVIFPIFLYDKLSLPQHRFLGTGFFIHKNLLVTARHVIEEAFLSQNGKFTAQRGVPYIIHLTKQNRYLQRPIISLSSSVDSDVCVAQVRASKHINRILPLKAEAQKVGEIAYTYAYPNSRLTSDSRGDIVNMYPAFYRGKVMEHFPEKRDSQFLRWPCYHVDFHMHGGASGGPAFDSQGRVFGVNCSSIEPLTNVSFVSSIDAIADASVHRATLNGKFYEELPVKILLEEGIIEIF